MIHTKTEYIFVFKLLKLTYDRVQKQEESINQVQDQKSQDSLQKIQASQNEDQSPKSENHSQSQVQNQEQFDRSSNMDQNDEDDSNVKSDDKQEQNNSGEDLKKQEPSGKKCFNKLCENKKIYKKLRSKVEHAKYRFLCKPCYENYCNNDFCEFCQQIYSNNTNNQEDDLWIGCDQCNRWNHLECEKKYRNKNINEIKDQDIQYLCLTCSFKNKNSSHNANPSGQNKQRIKKNYTNSVQDPSTTNLTNKHLLKQKFQISRDQRIPIFNRRIDPLPTLQYFLQNYNFRLWINQNLIKEDIETLRTAEKKISQEEVRKNFKKVKSE